MRVNAEALGEARRLSTDGASRRTIECPGLSKRTLSRGSVTGCNGLFVIERQATIAKSN